jgi:hypothetical protein
MSYGLVTTDADALSRLLDPEDGGYELVINVTNYSPFDKALTSQQTCIFDKVINRHKILQCAPTVLWDTELCSHERRSSNSCTVTKFPCISTHDLGFPHSDVEDSSSCMYRVTGVNRSRRFDGGTYCLCLEGLKGPTLQGEGTTFIRNVGLY